MQITGSLGVIHEAKQLGIISKVKPFIEKIQETNFRIFENIINTLLIMNNEVNDS